MDRTDAARKIAEYHNEEVQRKVKRTVQETAAAGEQTTNRTYSIVAQGTVEFQQKVLAITKDNVDAVFDCARELLAATSASEFIVIYTKYASRQFQNMIRQTKELTEVAQKAAIDSMGPDAIGLGSALLGNT